MPAVELPVVDREPALGQPRDGLARELDRDHGVLAPVGDEHGQPRAARRRPAPSPVPTGMKPENARIAAGDGRAASRPVA